MTNNYYTITTTTTNIFEESNDDDEFLNDGTIIIDKDKTTTTNPYYNYYSNEQRKKKRTSSSINSIGYVVGIISGGLLLHQKSIEGWGYDYVFFINNIQQYHYYLYLSFILILGTFYVMVVEQIWLTFFNWYNNNNNNYRQSSWCDDKINKMEKTLLIKKNKTSIVSSSKDNNLDMFFDCSSVLSEVDNIDDNNKNNVSVVGTDVDIVQINDEKPTYKDGKIVYTNGHPAFVPQGDLINHIPINYMEFYHGNQLKAQQAWDKTQLWRKDQNVWKITSMSHRWFYEIKQAYPHYVHGHSKSGYPIIYEQPGKMNLKYLLRNGCNVSDMIWHYTYFMEFISNRICTRPDIRRAAMKSIESKIQQQHYQQNSSSSWGIMVVMDVKGAGLSKLSGDVLKYLKQASDVNTAHYPNNMKRAFLVNSPFWLAGVWSSLRGILPESVQVDILSENNYMSTLRLYIDPDQIPKEYGGSSPYKLGEHPYEMELEALVVEGLKGSHDSDYSDEDVSISDMPGLIDVMKLLL